MLNISSLHAKFNNLSAREQKIVILGGPIIVCLFSWLLIIQPILATEERLTKAIDSKQQQLKWMIDNAAKTQTGRPSNTGSRKGISSKSQLRQVMNQLLKRYAISIDRIQNVNQQHVSYQLSKSNFNNILRLIKDSEDRGVSIVQLQVNENKKDKSINARLVVGL